MKKTTAKQLMDELVRCHEALDRAEIVAREIPDESFQKEIRQTLASASGSLWTEVMSRIIARYPNLNRYPRTEKGPPLVDP